jgi:hypothetical protein
VKGRGADLGLHRYLFESALARCQDRGLQPRPRRSQDMQLRSVSNEASASRQCSFCSQHHSALGNLLPVDQNLLHLQFESGNLNRSMSHKYKHTSGDICLPHIAAEPDDVCAMFHSISITPAVGPWFVNIRSWISMTPVS